MSSSEEPNIFATRDFRNFTPISQVSNGGATGRYDGSNTRLVSYPLPDGSICDGVLHTPVHFDSTQKYPVIFTYYERHSEVKNAYRFPEVSRAPLNIPWYLSRGYLVFEPDFYFTTGKTSESVLVSIDGAVRQLAKIPFVDTARMGVQGHSHGGYETNIIATGCHYFKAACEGSGYSNVISEYGSLRPGGMNNQRASDIDQRNLAVFPWEKPEVFVANSPVFHIGKMTTPLLIMHNKDDGAVNFSHAIEMYLGMRRIGKPVWMLEYDEEGHSVEDSMNKLDYTIRMQQFFDHYLKGAPPPVWMTRGIPAKEKGWVSGLALEADLSKQP
jgi:dipeptidyl aminopeptidase/acylaminoacyl peptidase